MEPENGTAKRKAGLQFLMPKKIIIKSFQSPGDIVVLTATIRDLHLSFPNSFLTDIRSPCPAIFENNPYITPISDIEADIIVQAEYPLIHRSNTVPYHFIHGYRLDLSAKLGVNIKPTDFKGDIHISDLEKSWTSQIEDITGKNTPFWIIVSGGKTDYTAKWWNPKRYQTVVNRLKGRIKFVQVGEKSDTHIHPPLDNVIDLRGKTDLRQLIRLVYHSDGVVCPVTMMSHLAAAVPVKEGRPLNRACVVIAGGREPSQWEAYPHHQFLHTNGALKCCDNGGCWKSRVVPLNDGDEKDKSLCEKPTKTENNIVIPKCMDMIGSEDVIRAIEKYLEWNK